MRKLRIKGIKEFTLNPMVICEKKKPGFEVTSISLENLYSFYRILASHGLDVFCSVWMPADGKLSAMNYLQISPWAISSGH